ncbi:dihydrolipoyl dehydrogenase family protein [Euzebya tangerina]|uniref:dihydrolipoyl dehydrogenase family protein n=1 Tax=Euzebya tangerina TaxID=591198 RepID=UPI000E321E04|nr:FAD-dependent oxidoreductase [Euzebya tangerina]
MPASRTNRTADFVVVGGGAAGLASAWTAARKGHSVLLIERHRLGGDCTWTGCVPSKALIDQARKVKAARDIGFDGEVNWEQIIGTVHRRREFVSQDESVETLNSQGIEVLLGEAAFTSPGHLSVEGTTVSAKKAIVLGTGSTALLPPIDGLAEANPLTNDTIFEQTSQPRSLAILGGGPIGLELGQAFQRLGTQVTIFEGVDRVASKEEPEASAVIQEVLEREGVEFVLGSFVTGVHRAGDTVTITTEDGRTVQTEEVLAAVGRRPVTSGLEPEKGGVQITDRGFIKVDEKLRTTADDVYAVGDITGGLQFTHVGYDHGALAVNNALGLIQMSFDPRVIPWATFTEPEIGRVGLSEAQAYDEYGDAARVAFMPIAETDRAKTSDETDGFVKLIAGPHTLVRGLAGGNLVGATVVSPTGGDLIHELALAVKQKTITGRLAQMVHAYPSWSLAIRETAAQFFFEYKGAEARPARPEGL